MDGSELGASTLAKEIMIKTAILNGLAIIQPSDSEYLEVRAHRCRSDCCWPFYWLGVLVRERER